MTIQVEVVYATPQRQEIIVMELQVGSTVREAAMQSGLAEIFPEIDLANVPLGVFGERVPDNRPLQQGDRVELYRLLTIDPMDARRRRASQ